MTQGIPINPIVKNQIITVVKDGEMSIYKAAEKYGLPYSTVKNWFKDKGIAGTERNYVSEINALKKELDNAYRVIGKLTTNTDYPKG